MKFVTVPGQGIRVQVHLSGFHHRADPVLLLPGIGGSNEKDFGLLHPLLARHRPVVAVDFAGPKLGGGELSLLHLEEQARAVLDEVLPQCRPIVIAQSLGAAVAVGLASKTKSFKCLVLASGWLTSTVSVRLFKDVWQQIALTEPLLLGHLGGLATCSPGFLNDQLLTAVDRFAPFGDTQFMTAQMLITAHLDLTSAAARVDVPTLVIGGTHDILAGPRQAALLAGSIPHAKYAEIASGHSMALEKPAEMHREIEHFLIDSRIQST